MPRPETYNESLESFQNYKERLDAYFIANDTEDDKKSPILLSVIGPKTYGVLKSLSAPVMPSVLTYDEISVLLNNHFNPRPFEIMERYRFHNRIQSETESVSDFVAALKNLTLHCNFGQYLLQALRDRFVCGLRCKSTQKRLLEEDPLNFERAIQLATSMEKSKKDIDEINTSGQYVNELKKNSYKKKQPTRKKEKHPPCESCGYTNHVSSKCFYRNYKCSICHTKGHLKAVCKNTQKKNNGKGKSFHDLEEKEEFELFSVEGPDKILIKLKMDEIPMNIELDTGAAMSVITRADYKNIF